jgi:hypothetical protein
MQQSPPTGTSLRAWFGLFAVACAWLALFANFPGNARQLLDVVWHLCFDASPRLWYYLFVFRNGIEALSVLALLAAIYLGIRGRPREYSLALLVLGWAFCGWALIVGIIQGHEYMGTGPPKLYRDFYQQAWLLPVISTLAPTLILTLAAQAIGVAAWSRRTASERWLVNAWLVMMANIALLLGGGLFIIEHSYPIRASRPDYPSLLNGRKLFTPTPPLRKSAAQIQD